MKKRQYSGVGFICMLVVMVPSVSCASALGLDDQAVPMEAGHILYVGGKNPGNYSTIQSAVDNASAGDTVFVFDDSAPYYENIVIRTPIQLLGENRTTTGIEGGDHAISIHADGVTVRGFRISNVGDFWNCCGFFITSDGNTISENIIIDNQRMNSVYLYDSSYNTISGNLIQDNQYHAIRLEYATHNVIEQNTIVNNRGYGIYLSESSENEIIGNTVVQSYWDGVLLGNHSGNNSLFHNTLIDNQANAYDEEGNSWDTGASGNYWSDYTGSDMNGDGIGDSPYQIPGGKSQDRYPLMKSLHTQTPHLMITVKGMLGFEITVKNVGTTVALESEWEFHLSGGIILVPSDRNHNGSIRLLIPGQELVLQRVDVMVGIGMITVVVNVGNSTASQRGLVLFFLFLPLSG